MSDEPTSSSGHATSSREVHTPSSRVQPAFTSLSVGAGGGNSTAGPDATGRRATTASSPSFSSSPNAGEDDQPQAAAAAATEHKMRKSCDYCVRMKRACDGKTPCELCTRRNKDCTRSVKKKSGPAKGTKYAARRTRSQDDFGRSSLLGGGAGRAGSGSRSGTAGIRRTTSSDDRRFPPLSSSSGPTVPSRIHGTSYRLASHSCPQILERTSSFQQGDSRLMPPGAGGIGREVERVADMSAGVGGMAIGGMRSGGDGVVGMIGVGGRPTEELSVRHQQQLGSGEGGHDIESQQLIKNFPGVLQDTSIWTSPSPEELQIARNLEPDTLGRPMPTIPTGPSQQVDTRLAAERHSYREVGRGTRAWDAGANAGDDRARTTGVGMSARSERYGGSGGAGGGGHDSVGSASSPFDWNPQLPPQPDRRTGGSVGGAGDQPHYFPRAMQRSQHQQQQQRGQLPGQHGMPSSGRFSAIPSSGSGGLVHGARDQGTHPNLPPLGSIGRGAYHGSGSVGAAGELDTRPGFRSTDQRVGGAMKIEEGSDISPPQLRFPAQEGDTFSSSDPLLPLQQQLRHHQYQQQQQQQDVWPWHRMTTQGLAQPSLPSFSHPSTMPHDTPHSPEDRLFLPLPSQEAPRRIPSLDFPVPNVSGLSVDTAATVTGAVAQPGLSTQDLGWTRPEMAWRGAQSGEEGDARSLQAQSLPPPGASGVGGEMGGAYVSEFGARRQSGGQDSHR